MSSPEPITNIPRDSARRTAQSLPSAPPQRRYYSSVFDLLRRTGGSQLLELALSLPIMLVVMVAVADFGQAWNIKQKLANAAREGTRIAVSAPTFEATNCANPSASSPCSVQATADTVKQYMVNAGLNASCLTPNTPTPSGTSTYTYSCSGLTMTITRPYLFTASSGAQVMGTQVSLTYPYTWNLSQIVGILHAGTPSLPSTISTNSVMPNLN